MAIHKNCYVFDLETYKNFEGWFVPYACGWAKLFTLTTKDFSRDVVNIDIGENCVMDMLLRIDKLIQKTKKTFKSESGKNVTLMDKTDVFLFAHNSSNFDTYFFL